MFCRPLRKLISPLAFAVLAFGLATESAWGWGGIGSTKGTFDDLASCDYSFTNLLTGSGVAFTYTSDGEGSCTFTQAQKGRNKPPIVEVATCSTHFEWPVTRACTSVPGGSVATYTGLCQPGITPVIVGWVNCDNGGTGPREGLDPLFCDGTPCIWNHGFGLKAKGGTFTGMDPTQCAQFDTINGGSSFLYRELFNSTDCTGDPTGIEEAVSATGQSHTWLDTPPYVATDKQGTFIVALNASTAEQGALGPVTADIDPQSFSGCGTGTFTARIHSFPSHLGTVAIQVNDINVDTVEVNGVPAVPRSCTIDNSSTADPRLSCSVPRCVSGVFTGDITTSPGNALFTTTGSLNNGTPFVSETVSRSYTP